MASAHPGLQWSAPSQTSIAFFDKQLGNTKIQQFDFAVVAHQHIGRLNIPMNNQVGMGFGHGAQHVEKKPDSAVHVELVFLAILVDGHSVNIFKDEIRGAVGRDAGIQQFGDMRMSKSAEDSSFAFESFFGRTLVSAMLTNLTAA